jgi:hypothetical protein
MRLKDNTVTVENMHPRMTWAMFEADQIWFKLGQELIVTSGDEKTARHSRTSLHYAGAAADFRTNYFNDEEKNEARDNLALTLGADFDCILESDHLHCEWQPKRRF